MKLTWSQCASILMVSQTTLWRRAVELGIGNEPTSITDLELDEVDQYQRCSKLWLYYDLGATESI